MLNTYNGCAALSAPAWFCLRSHPKREHIAAAHLRALPGVEVFNPRLRIKKATRRGIVAFVESLFPNYIFARFDISLSLQSVKNAPNVSTVVHFGGNIPVVADEVITELRAELDEDETQEQNREVREGDKVQIGHGPFRGMNAVVLRVLTPYQRVEILLDILGRSTAVTVDPTALKLEV